MGGRGALFLYWMRDAVSWWAVVAFFYGVVMSFLGGAQGGVFGPYIGWTEIYLVCGLAVATALVISLLPSQRLRAHARMVAEAQEIFAEAFSDPPDATKRAMAASLALRVKNTLENDFSIGCPGLNIVDGEGEIAFRRLLQRWTAFLATVRPAVERGKLKEARNAINDMRKLLGPWAQESTP